MKSYEVYWAYIIEIFGGNSTFIALLILTTTKHSVYSPIEMYFIFYMILLSSTLINLAQTTEENIFKNKYSPFYFHVACTLAIDFLVIYF